MDRRERSSLLESAVIQPLRDALSGPLPGERAHRAALPPGGGHRVLPTGAKTRLAAVLLALHPDREGSRLLFPLIVRPDSMIRHAGQVSLPGGVLDESEDTTQCALREAWEEIGLEPQSVDVLGRLTPIVIPVSSFEVETIVGWIPQMPDYRPGEEEVIRIVRGDPDRLAAEGPVRFVERTRNGRSLKFPAYAVEGETVWGATALILSEFLEIWRGLRPPPPVDTAG